MPLLIAVRPGIGISSLQEKNALEICNHSGDRYRPGDSPRDTFTAQLKSTDAKFCEAS